MSTENTTNVTTNATVSREFEAKVIKKVLPKYKDFFESCSESSTYTTSSGMRNFLKEVEKSLDVFIPNFPELKSLKERVTSVKDATTSSSNPYSYEMAMLKTLSAHIDVIVENIE